jgi:beta-fructofuranosidase
MNINDGIPAKNWDQIMSVPQQLSLAGDKSLRIRPVDALSSLRGREINIGETRLPANKEVVLKNVEGNSLELEFEIDPQESRWVQLNVFRSPNAEERTSITFYNFDRRISIWYETHSQLVLDTTYSSESPDAWMRPPEKAELQLRPVKGPGEGLAPGENLKLRVLIDRSVVEVFANDRLYMAARVYPTRSDSIGVSLQARGQDATLKSLKAWSMESIWPIAQSTIRE